METKTKIMLNVYSNKLRARAIVALRSIAPCANRVYVYMDGTALMFDVYPVSGCVRLCERVVAKSLRYEFGSAFVGLCTTTDGDDADVVNGEIDTSAL